MIASLLGRHFWLPALLALVAGFLVPGSFGEWRVGVTPLLGGILFFSCLNVTLGHLRASLTVGGLRRLLVLSALKLGAMPVLAWLLARFLAPEWAPGVLLVSAMPAGLTSIAFADLNGGSREMALLFVLVTSLLCPISVPVLIEGLGGAGSTVAMGALLDRAFYILEVLLIPFLLAQLIRHLTGSLIDRHRSLWTRLAILFSCLLIFVSIAINRGSWRGWPTVHFLAPLLLTIFATALFGAICWLASRRLELGDSIAFACGSLYMNNGLAVVLAVRFFPGSGHMILPAILIQVSMVLGVVSVGRIVRRRSSLNRGAAIVD